MTNKRTVSTDVEGFFVNNIRLTKAIESLKSLVNSTILSDFTLFMIEIPGSRVIFADFMAFFVHFDRLQFYYFHNRNYSQYSTLILADINIINDLKGVFFQNVLQLMKPNISIIIDNFFTSIDYKYQYTPSIIL
jgi:hypothetical protein